MFVSHVTRSAPRALRFALATIALGLLVPAFDAVADPGPPRFHTFSSPPGSGDDAGEPSIGINWQSEQTFSNSLRSIPNGGAVNYFGGFMPYMLNVIFDDCRSPALATWNQKPLLTANTPRVFGDPILYTDKATGRTLVSQLEGLTPAGSTTDYTDDDGDNFLPTEGSGLPACVDHQTLGGGPFHAPLPPGAIYPNAVYYCSQCVSNATCSLSLDGGITFLPGVNAFSLADCVGLHGHIKVGPDGTAYIPNKGCGGALPFHEGGYQGVVVSTDNGLTWTVKEVDGSTSNGLDQHWDPSVAIATDNTVYFGYRDAQGRAKVAVSTNQGDDWFNNTDVGAALGIKRIAFPEMVAGDGDRAAFAFYGTTTDIGDDTLAEFTGVWYLFVASTFDRGATWTIVNATPGDPIQRGGICHDGACRNMLDFMDASIDKQGRILVGWDDGCIGGCVSGAGSSTTAKATITRQCGGKRMFAAFDPVEPALPEAPGLAGSKVGSAILLSWAAPDHNGSPLTAYKVYRKLGAGGTYALLATVTAPAYTDLSYPLPATDNYYKVTAVNAVGEGPFCNEFHVSEGPVATGCLEPGITVINDLNVDETDADAGQNTPPDGSVNVRQLFVSEPYLGPGVNRLVFRMQLAPSLLTSPPPNSQWFVIWNALNPTVDFDRRYVAMRTDASGVPSFEYGRFGVPLDPLNPNINANTPVAEGAADAGTFDLLTGAIRIELANSKAENIAAGQSLVGMNVRTYLNRPDPGQRSQNNASDITGESSYDLVGNAACFCYVNDAPVAALSASPTSGIAPLTVDFDASASSDPNTIDGDAVGSYTFTFGDGTPPVTQSSPTISHTYETASGPSGYFATLTVNDQKCGTQSLNVSAKHIEVSAGPTGVGPNTPSEFRIAPVSNPSYQHVYFTLDLVRDGLVKIEMYSVDGRRVAELMNSWQPAGKHTVHWRGFDRSGRQVPAGVYMVRATSGDLSTGTRLVFTR